MTSEGAPASTIAGYDRIAADFDRKRKPKPWERPFFERLADALPPGATILDCGCGSGHLGIAWLLKRRCRVIGLDGSSAMLALFRLRYPDLVAIQGDMREFETKESFDGIVAWDSFFHLSQKDQRAMIPRWASWLRPGGELLFTTGPGNATIEGEMFGVTFSYSSFAEEEYRAMLTAAGFTDIISVFDEPDAKIHKVWTARQAS